MESFECDVVVIGAGLSGLSAAFYLWKKDRGLRIAIVEAKDRIGGRTLTRQISSADGTKDFWDLGGEWVGRPQPHLHYLLRKFHINTFNPVAPQGGSEAVNVPVLSWQTRLDLMQFTWKLKRLRKKLAGGDLKNSVHALVWDGISFEKYREENLWTQEAKNLVDAACRCMFGLAPAEMTLLYFLMYIRSAGGLQIFDRPGEYTGAECRVKGGVHQISTHLVHKIGKRFVYLNQPVSNIVQSIEGARVTTSNNLQILCQRVIMAIPPHHAAAIEYQPPLPAVKLGLLQSVPLAFLVKFAITYEEAFWKEDNDKFQYGFQGVLEDSELGPVGIVYDASSGRGNPALAGFISSSQGLDGDPKSKKAVILKLVESLLGPQCHKLLEFSQMDWSKEPYNGGCFLKSLMPGTTKYFNSELREPFDRIHFAGTETATVWCGFMNGAVQSGFRAATEVLYHLRPLIITSPDPEVPRLDDEEFSKGRDSSHWLALAILGMGFASAYYFLTKTNKFSAGTTLVKNIRLVFDS
ncbi:probable flavin-containing monoamine oxidase A [Aplysia californica]|uniref:Amine oxidase n=1 Tax=Aplysia californica TaxID=6500 RepID=A0ABM0JPG2_APLCA|nr:probable flavin-containing monoamine oxidase A [Aplysia californica]